MNVTDETAVLRCAELGLPSLRALLEPFGLRIVEVAADAAIPGSYWGDSEAGQIGAMLYLRSDTPVHSALHEACHWLCADAARRQSLHTNAGGEDVEEHAVCYLQCRLAARLSGYSQTRCFADMDSWGYSFRLGSTAAWFADDADDAIAWLAQRWPGGMPG